MPATHTLPLGDLLVTVRELTFAEVRAWLVETSASEYRDPVQALAFVGLGLDELARMCDVSADVLERFTASELAPLVEAAKALNAPFFRVRSLLMKHVDQLTAAEALTS